ncbi:protein CUP-SHAPED COTYLEDON 1-like [Tripterygium wilfordii]|uniref:protein CUP-SHAPED COTYLEDON 1-like n=1 Tax=Tripterygium wilfordii TaxID=458696 RepID=UPI0018F80184|nr:protein CUP-SHAPED COTYLEDON 1-like [Tripterygium wilfordii]
MVYTSGFSELPPLGYRFVPTPEELITYHLLPKVTKVDTSKLYSPIKDVDVYGNDYVWMKECGEYDRCHARNTRYYFTILKKKSDTGSRFERGTLTGKWKEERDDMIEDPKTRLQIGSVRSFSYQPKNEYKNMKEIKDRKWNMQEYRLDGKYKDIEGSSTLVLCQVKETTRPKKNHRRINTTPPPPPPPHNYQEVEGEVVDDDAEDMEALCALIDDALMEEFDQNPSSLI